MTSKAEVSQHVMNFVQLIETQHKTIRTDNGPEFLMPYFYSSKGIIHQKSCVESPQQNGRVEIKHQHILNVARSLLFHSNLPKQFWCYVVSHVVFIINCVFSPLLENKSPYFFMHDKLPDLKILKVFGSLVYASTLHSHRTKLDLIGRECVFLCFKSGMKGSILLDLNNKETFVSRNTTHMNTFCHIIQFQNLPIGNIILMAEHLMMMFQLSTPLMTLYHITKYHHIPLHYQLP